jgi:hypothetical protein
METVKQVQTKYTRRALMLSIMMALVFILMGYKPMGKGLVLGTLFSIFNFILMGKSIALKIGRPKGQTFSISIGSIIFRYILLAIPLIAALKFEQLNLVATIAGIFMIQIVILVDHLLKLIPSVRRKQI